MLLIAVGLAPIVSAYALAGEFSAPWRDKSVPIILDAYEKNPIDWQQVVKNKQIFGFIGKASDGLPPRWGCRKPNATEQTLCKKTFQNYWLKKELYKTRKMVAKGLGLKWGAYHLGRPGNPIDQANHFVDFTEPEADDLLALDIEHDDPEKWISLRDAETFVKHIKFRTGRYPILYTNHDTAKRIAARRAELPVLSRLPLWYARYRSSIPGAFPMGHWESYAIWQFSAHPNCNKRRCLYRVKGTKPDIDVNVASMKFKELEKAWPFGGLVPLRDEPKMKNPNLKMVSADQGEVTASIVSVAKKEPVTRFKMKLEIEDHSGKKIAVSSIAVPSPRTRIASALGFEVAALDEVDAIAALPRLMPKSVIEAKLHLSDETITKSDHYSAPSATKIERRVTKAQSKFVPAREEAIRDLAKATVKRPIATYGYSNKLSFSAYQDTKAR
ncbi:MAG: GH25 family lysozyme [Rhizobiaceae bacterium]|nr:GH25 family lysozyme [Rhizobiaceae bacterium]